MEDLQKLLKGVTIEEDRLRIQQMIADMKRKEILQKYHIWQGKDGRWYVHLMDGKKRIMRRAKSRADLEDVILDWEEDFAYNPTFEELYMEWNDDRVRLKQIRESSGLRYRDLFKQKLKPLGDQKVRTFTPSKCADFLEELAPDCSSYRIWLSAKNALFSVLAIAKRKELIDFNVEDVRELLRVTPRQFVKKVRPDNEEVYTEEEIRKLTDLFMSYFDDIHVGLLLMVVTGMRVGELSALKPTDVTNNSVWVRRTEVHYVGEDGKAHLKVGDFPKTQKSYREVIVPTQYHWLLDRIRLRTTEYCFYGPKGGRAQSDSFRVRLKEDCKKLGIPYRTPHKIRKTYATALLDDGIDSRLVSEQMGHSSAVVTEMYYHRDRRTTDDKERLISSVPDFCDGEPEGTTRMLKEG